MGRLAATACLTGTQSTLTLTRFLMPAMRLRLALRRQQGSCDATKESGSTWRAVKPIRKASAPNRRALPACATIPSPAAPHPAPVMTGQPRWPAQ